MGCEYLSAKIHSLSSYFKPVYFQQFRIPLNSVTLAGAAQTIVHAEE